MWHFLFFIHTDLTGLEQGPSQCIILPALWYHVEIPVWDWSSTVAEVHHLLNAHEYTEGVHAPHSHKKPSTP